MTPTAIKSGEHYYPAMKYKGRTERLEGPPMVTRAAALRASTLEIWQVQNRRPAF